MPTLQLVPLVSVGGLSTWIRVAESGPKHVGRLLRPLPALCSLLHLTSSSILFFSLPSRLMALHPAIPPPLLLLNTLSFHTTFFSPFPAIHRPGSLFLFPWTSTEASLPALLPPLDIFLSLAVQIWLGSPLASGSNLCLTAFCLIGSSYFLTSSFLFRCKHMGSLYANFPSAYVIITWGQTSHRQLYRCE